MSQDKKNLEKYSIYFPEDSGLILDLQAGEPPEDGGNGSRIPDFRRDYSGKQNHLDRVDGPGPVWLKEGLNGNPTLLFEGDSLLTMSKNLIGDYDSYTIISLARYSGNKRGRIISSSNNNWLFGFHDGYVGSWFTGQWLDAGNKDDSKSWRLQSAVVNLDGSNLLKSWDNGEVIFSGQVDIESRYRSIGKMSIGGWRNAREQPSECEVARILVFDKALSVQEIKHYEFLIKRQYSILEYDPRNYLEWAISTSQKEDLNPLVSKEAARVALALNEDEKTIKELMRSIEYSESGFHSFMSDFLFKKNDEKFIFHTYMSFFLDPNNPQILFEMMNKIPANDTDGVLRGMNLLELMCVEGNERGLEQALSMLNRELSNSESEVLSSYVDEKRYLLEKGRYGEFFDQMNRFLLDNGSICSTKITNKLEELYENPKIKQTIIDKLNENSESPHVVRFSTEYFKFHKRRNVGGFADRIKGATTVMLLSIALGKRFEIDWKYPFDISEIFECVDYDWTVKDPNLEANKLVLIDSHFSEEYREILAYENIENKLDCKKKSLEIYCNLYFDKTLLNNKSHSILSKGDMGQITQPLLVGTMLSLLGYRPNLFESLILTNFFSFLSMYEQSIAIHFRTGGDGTWKDPVVDSPENVHKLFEKAKSIIIDTKKKTCVYFATDSEKLKNAVLNKYGKELEIFSVNIPLAHIDRSTGSKQISGSRFSIMENYMISLCDHILAGKGAFSVLAANRRYQWPWRYYKTH